MPPRKPYKKLITDQLSEVGKLPPQATDLEEAVLGAIMLDTGSLIHVIDILRVEIFYKEIHGIIFNAIKILYDRSEPIDILTVTQQLRYTNELEKVGGAYFVTQLTNKGTNFMNIQFHARIILQKYIQRECIKAAADIIKGAYDPQTDVFDLLSDSQTYLNNLISGVMRKSEQGSVRLFSDFLNHLDTVAQSDNAITGIPTTLTELDSITRGFQKTDLIIICGRPGQGKSSALKPIIKGALRKEHKVLLFSMEMSSAQQIGRLLSEDTNTPSQAFNSKEFLKLTSFPELQGATSSYCNKNGEDLLYINDSPSLSVSELCAISKRVVIEKDISIIMIDYIGMLSGSGENKVYELEDICFRLKGLAKDLKIPVIGLAQLNRDVEKDNPPIPKLSHLRSSGAIEQYADQVIALYRPIYYKIENLADGTSTANYSEWHILKNRNGICDTIKVRFDARYTKFSNWDGGIEINNATTAYNANAGLSPNQEFGIKTFGKDNTPAPF